MNANELSKYSSLLAEVRRAAESNDMNAVKAALDSADQHQRDMSSQATQDTTQQGRDPAQQAQRQTAGQTSQPTGEQSAGRK